TVGPSFFLFNISIGIGLGPSRSPDFPPKTAFFSCHPRVRNLPEQNPISLKGRSGKHRSVPEEENAGGRWKASDGVPAVGRETGRGSVRDEGGIRRPSPGPLPWGAVSVGGGVGGFIGISELNFDIIVNGCPPKKMNHAALACPSDSSPGGGTMTEWMHRVGKQGLSLQVVQ
ncbi:hypothetical protein GWI33_015540, partial [Rhynchophorus ferrugineus]